MNYWERHYADGGRSGEGSINEARTWKQNILKEYNVFDESIIDIGCGDLEFWENWFPANYTGIDISKSIIHRNKMMYPGRNFICSSSADAQDIQANVVTCFDVLFHIMDEDDYIKTIENIVKYSTKYIFIYTWYRNPFESIWNRFVWKKPFHFNMITDGKYQYYRPFGKPEYQKPMYDAGFSLCDYRQDERWKYGAMYIYEK
jgi:2-polyprenyl-3-methyl-5-hydroxy-6-metoxy-1,4-benzoquinol methylase